MPGVPRSLRLAGGLWSLYGLHGILLRRKPPFWPRVAFFNGGHHPKAAQTIFNDGL
ncbi:hypothetical protein SCLCIDRAFT_1223301 [Scleroderma citrinum Foug A]|uniref:Uncharacterized protein n=1 Tax=Scleroderma citrinum Foug A TaxID=1036808 RepID=A0A0C3D925_9AGAM|nr:hypothetical protein SCLCIDRAFT_1223301 [Scleroderma citrinum Foug A]